MIDGHSCSELTGMCGETNYSPHGQEKQKIIKKKVG